MKQKEILENLTDQQFPEPTPQEYIKKQYPNSPFWIIGNDEKGYNLTMGKYKLNQTPFETIHDLEIWMSYNMWNNIISMIICTTTEIINNQNKQ